MTFVNRFFLNVNGALTFTGNTLGLSRSERVGVPGTVDSIGAFITTSTSSQFGTYPPGTTSLFQSNSAAAVLSLPAGSSVLYAELIWGGMYINNGVDLSGFIDQPVTFTTPAGTYRVAPTPATSFNVLLAVSSGFPNGFAYTRSADVTDLVVLGGAGNYTTGNVVGTLVIPDPTSNHAGWTLAVAYQNPALPLRNLSLRVGATVIQAASGPVDTVITGFATPVSGSIKGRILLSAQEGDANKTGDQALFGRTLNSLQVLSGPNNFANNFFASQINKDDGSLDTSGTFGNRNQVNGAPGSNIVGGRQGYDITNVDGSAALERNQTSAYLRLTTSGDGYLVNANGIQIDIDQPLVQVSKTASQNDAVVGDIITYTIRVVNTGKVPAQNAVLFDNQTSSGTTFEANSVIINGTAQPGENPFLGISVGDIPPGGSVTLIYRLKVTSIPEPAVLVDQGRVSYSFQPNPSSPVLDVWVPSNIVKIPVYEPIVVAEKSADQSQVNVGDTITYTIKVQDTGNIPVNVIVEDIIPLGTSFVPDSVSVNGSNVPFANPVSGIAAGIIQPGQLSTVTFQVLVTSSPPDGILRNTADISFIYKLPDGRELTGTAVSNELTIPVSSPLVNVVKSVTPAAVIVGETLTYSVFIENQSTGTVTNVVVNDPLPQGSTFVSGSVTVNGTPTPGVNPANGINVGTISGSGSALVTFQVIADSLPSPPELINQATATFTFGTTTGSSTSDEVTVPVFEALLVIGKSADPQSVTLGETINYNVFLRNIGNIAVSPVVLDPLSPFVTFIPGTAAVDAVSDPTESPLTGITVPLLQPGESAVVSFQVSFTSAPPDQLILNTSTANFSYELPDGRTLTNSVVSNTNIVQDPITNIEVIKTANILTAVIGDIITYSVEVINTTGTPITSARLLDINSDGVRFVAGSVQINSNPAPSAVPSEGFDIGPIPAGGSTIVTFQETVTSGIPIDVIRDQSRIDYTIGAQQLAGYSNPVSVQVQQPIITASKRAAQQWVTIGDVIHYTITVSNTGNTNFEAIVSDVLPEGTVFAENSVLMEEMPMPGDTPISGISIGSLSPEETADIVFHVRVIAIPPSGFIINQGKILFTYSLPDGRTFSGYQQTNQVQVRAIGPGTPSLTKSANKSAAVLGDKIKYTVRVNNSTPFPIENLHLIDPAPLGLEWIAGSVMVQHTVRPLATPETGIELEPLPPGESLVVTYRAIVCFEPPKSVAVNTAELQFVSVLPDGRRIPGNVRSNAVTVEIEENEE
ncbi:hypothetical protein Q5741_06510 [Paenibacillus sp. JX-17]|uniref:DUF11 domain-containing protein n=1 Tax=Paenibacillus lacisoli TaxID=3064525 RepID=A0ABT9CB22_9BACL|nr:hypothetical protein [Paenibacillus sp. JX-17]MDO7906070.1 hypothetical protein [Paenibacillus sp. JX-17]